MPQSKGSHSDVPPAQFEGSDFGANEWLVEEMYDQYQRDPGSVDATWVEYFKANNGASGASNGTPQRSSRSPRRRPGRPAVRETPAGACP